MEIKLMKISGTEEALFGIGLSYGLTSEYEGWDDVPFDRRMKLQEIASKLCRKGAGEDKFLRQIECWWCMIVCMVLSLCATVPTLKVSASAHQ